VSLEEFFSFSFLSRFWPSFILTDGEDSLDAEVREEKKIERKDEEQSANQPPRKRRDRHK